MSNGHYVKLVAVCGGIASGKSVVIEALKACGANVLSCDAINRELLEQPEYIKLLEYHFDGIVEEGKVNKLALRKLILHDETKKALLNSLAHPRIFEQVVEKAREIGGLVFVEVPLLSNAMDRKIFAKLWFVKAAHDLRISRLMRRDNMSQVDAERFIALQIKENEIEEFADRIIVNNGTYNQLCDRIKEFYQQELFH